MGVTHVHVFNLLLGAGPSKVLLSRALPTAMFMDFHSVSVFARSVAICTPAALPIIVIQVISSEKFVDH